ncbi:MAG: M48 family metalloprotease [Planctomycetota bacterium]|jgi:predicted Zn-dependent protease
MRTTTRRFGLLALTLLLQLGCRGAAEHSVRVMAFREGVELQEGRATIHDPEVDDYLDELGGLVLHAARELGDVPPEKQTVYGNEFTAYDRFDVVLVHSPALNAWVYGDDFVCVTTNFVLQAETPEEIVAVLCHEFAHLEECHLVEMREREIGHHVVGDLIEIAGGVGELALMTYGIPISVSGLARRAAADHRRNFEPHRPEDEFEADREGLELYASMGLDLEHYDDFYERMLEVAGDRSARSHPMMSQRLHRIDDACDSLDVPVITPTTLDPDALRAAQDRLRDVVLAKAAANELVAFEDEMLARSDRHRASVRATMCCPFSPDRDRLWELFVQAVKQRPTDPAPASGAGAADATAP